MKFAASPLTPLQFGGLAGGLVFLAASYCLAHGLISHDVINLPRTLAWAVGSTLPWVCAWEGLKRLRAQSLRPVQCALILIAALAVSAAFEYALAAIYTVDAAPFAQILYRLLPIPLALAVAAKLLQPPPKVQVASQVLNVPTRDGVISVDPRQVEYVKAAGNYVELMTGDRTLLMRTTLQELSEQLRGVGFVRVHRSVLVNEQHVLGVRRGPRGRRVVKMRGGAQLPVGRQFEAFVPNSHRSPQQG